MSELAPSDLARAAEVVVQSVLRVTSSERVVVVADADSTDIAQALAAAATRAGASQVTIAHLDELRSVSTNHSGERPHKVLPDLVRRSMLGAQASVFVASAPHQELSMREQLLHIVTACSVRHAHMPAVSRRAFAWGQRVEYDKVQTWGQALRRRLELAKTAIVTSSAGTNLQIAFNPERRWIEKLAAIEAGTWCNLPAGALYTASDDVDGLFIANASIGEFFGAREGLLLERPVRLRIEAGRVVSVEAPGLPDLQRDIEATLSFAPNSDRVGLLSFGVNVGIEAPTGEALVDQNMPGLHLLVGDPAGRTTGVSWTARTSFAACQTGSKVVVDGVTAIDAGRMVSVP